MNFATIPEALVDFRAGKMLVVVDDEDRENEGDDGLNPKAMLKPPADSWPTYNGDYTGRRYSALAQINQSNVGQLTVAWMAQMKSVAIKSTPLLVNGILYMTTPDNVWALEPRTGRAISGTTSAIPKATRSGSAAWGCTGDWLYFETPDCHFNITECERRLGSLETSSWPTSKIGYFATWLR